jgi:cytochrome c biogenesis protein CcmG/thiol:disulfide interchange protein DsbE
MRRLVAFAPLVALVVAVILFGVWALNGNPHVTPMAMLGKPVPDVQLDNLDGSGRTSLRAAIKGPALVNFYASWCGPCAEESPTLMALKLEGVRIVGVSYEDRRHPGDTAGFLSRLGDPYAVKLEDPLGMAGIDFGVTGVPETYAVDAHGVIRAKRALPIDAADAEALLQAASK